MRDAIASADAGIDTYKAYTEPVTARDKTIAEAQALCDRRVELRRKVEAGEISVEEARREFPESF